MIELGGVGHLVLPFVGGVGGGRLYVVLVVGAVLVVMGGGEVQRLPGSSPMRAARATQQQGGLLMAHLSRLRCQQVLQKKKRENAFPFS
jgi:hypothetical protein